MRELCKSNLTSWETPYKFSGKDKDDETGYSYFGVRYYSSDLSVWLSVDPMSEERPNLSPYNYSSWNPVMRIDPNGELDDWVERNGEIVYDKDVKKGEDGKIQNLKEGDKYLGKSGSAIDPETDQYTRYNEDGTKTSKPISLEGVEVHGSGNVNNIKNPSISTNNKNGYIWNERDLAVWKHLKNGNDPISRYVQSQISQGYYPMLSAKNFYDTYGYQTGNLMVFEEFFGMMNAITSFPGTNLRATSSKGLKATTSKKLVPKSIDNNWNSKKPTFQEFYSKNSGSFKGYKGKGTSLKAAHETYKQLYGN